MRITGISRISNKGLKEVIKASYATYFCPLCTKYGKKYSAAPCLYCPANGLAIQGVGDVCLHLPGPSGERRAFKKAIRIKCQNELSRRKAKKKGSK